MWRRDQILSGQLLLRTETGPGRKQCAALLIPNICIIRSQVGDFEAAGRLSKQEGSNFSLQKFHDEMLRHGAPPLRLLREVMLKDGTLWDKVL